MKTDPQSRGDLKKEVESLRKQKSELERREQDRQQMENALRESELKFRTLFNSANNAIFIMKNGKFNDCNAKALEIFACSKDQIIGKTLHRFSPKEQPEGQKSKEILEKKIAATLAGTQQVYEWIHMRRSGSLFWADVSLNRFELNKIYYILVIVRDITDRKQSERALQESEERYRALFERANEGILVADIETKKYVMSNPAVTRMLGYGAGEIKGMGIWEIHPPELQKKVISQYGALVKGEKSLAPDIPCMRRDGTTFYADIKAFWAIIDGRECLVSFFTDVTERRVALRALEESEARLRAILNSLQLGVIIIDAETRQISDSNSTVSQMIGISNEEIIGSPCHKYLCLDNNCTCPILDRGEVIINAEHKLLNSVGEEIPILKTVTPITLSNRQYLLESFIDISEKKRLEAQLIQAQKMEAVGRLAGGIAHDFNNLLMAISGHTELILMKMEKDDPIRRRIEEIKKAGERAASLTRQLLAFSRKQMLKPAILDLNQLVSGIEAMLNRLIGEDIVLMTSFNKNIKRIKADAGQIDQIIMNLAINARDAMPEGGELMIETENVAIDETVCQYFPESTPGEYSCLSISDSGTGMEPEMIRQIFEPFFTTKETGTGLGLSVVYGIVKQHGGWIKVYSAPGIGSNFQIFFPVAENASEEIDLAKHNLVNEYQGNGEHILVVEDEESVRRVTVEALREKGYKVTEVSTATAAGEIFDKKRGDFDLVFSDIVLPDQPGLQLVEYFLQIKPELKVVLTSGYPGQKSQWKDINRKGFHFVQKPFTLLDLLRAVSEALDERVEVTHQGGSPGTIID